MHIGEVIGKPFQIIWKHKVLWLLGAIGCFLGAVTNAIMIGFIMKNRDLFSASGETFRMPPTLMNSQFYRWFQSLENSQIPLSLIILFVCVFVFFVSSWLISLLVSSSLVCGTRMADEGSADMRFGTIVKQGWKPFGKQVLFSLLISAVVTVVLMLIVLAYISIFSHTDEDAISILILTLCCSGMCIGLPALFFITLFTRLIGVTISHENTPVFASIKKAWQTLRKSFGMFLLFHLILGAMTYAANLIPSFVNSLAQGVSAGFTTARVVLVAGISGLLNWIFSSFILTYTVTAWTLAFRRVAYPPTVEMPPIPQ